MNWNLQVLRSKGSFFWVIFVLVPLLTGLLAYHWDPREIYSKQGDLVLQSHEVCDSGTCGPMVDVWRDKQSGEIFRRSDFINHRHSEANRMAYLWFMYGLIGCYYFAFQASTKEEGKFTQYLTIAVVVNAGIAVLTWFNIVR